MAETSTAAGMREFVLYWVSGDYTGVRRTRAPDAETARRDLETNGSRYGLPHERVTVLKVLRCVVIDSADARIRD